MSLKTLQYSLFKPYQKGLAHATFLRVGGMSSGPYTSLNCSFSVGDDPQKVQSNREKIAKHFFPKPQIVWGKLVHGTSIWTVTAENQKVPIEADILFTREKNIALAITHADCQAALFYDPKKQAIAAVHAGWRGLVSHIYEKTVDFFVQTVGSDPKNLLVALAPSLGPLHSEFKNYKEEFPEEFWKFQSPLHANFFNLWEIALFELEKSHVLKKHIELSPHCTYNEPKNFFSYRRDKTTGRQVSLIFLKEATL